MWIFTDNNDFFGGHVRGQDRFDLQAHVGYNFGPNFWLAADAIYYTGGRTSRTALPGMISSRLHALASHSRYRSETDSLRRCPLAVG